MLELKIQASRCKQCERTIIPPRETCPYCGKKAGIMDPLELDNQATVVSHTTLQIPPEGFEPPLTMALVELEYGAVALCLAKNQNEPRVSIGDRVSLSFDSEKRIRFTVLT
jgi:uncharacterized OB-fold protein